MVGVIIGEWIKGNKGDYFAEYTRHFEDVETNLYMPKQFRSTEKVARIDGYRITADIPYTQMKIHLQSKYPNIPYYDCIIIFVFSLTEICFFTTGYQLILDAWETRHPDLNMVKWSIYKLPLVDKKAINEKIIDIIKNFSQMVQTNIEDKFKMQGEKSEKGTKASAAPKT